jgi:probable F420-dependent oxidoreductase
MIELKSGIFLPTFWSDYGTLDISQAMIEVAGAADSLGFDSLWACDHIVAPERHAGSARCLEPMILMASLAQRFPKLVVGTDVLVLPQRNAILVAKQAATLSVLTGGRFVLGIGAGWNEDEFKLLGADFEQRGAHTDEAIELMRTLWRQTPASFSGSFYQLQDAYFYPNPEGDGPPIWVGGSSSAALARAARFGDGWMPFWGKWEDFTKDLEKFRRQVQQLRASERGQAIKIIANVPLRIAEGSDEYATDAPQPAAQIIAALRDFRDAGLETVIWNIQSKDLQDYLQQMRLAAQQIVPNL